MKLLILSKNSLQSKGVHHLAKCVHKIQSLLLDGCGLLPGDVINLTRSMGELPVSDSIVVSEFLQTLKELFFSLRRFDH